MPSRFPKEDRLTSGYLKSYYEPSKVARAHLIHSSLSKISKMQKFLLSLALIPLATNLIPILPAQGSSEQKCLSTIADAQQRLQGSLNVDIITKIDDQSKYRSDHPKNRPMSYTFGFKGTAADSIMRSGRLQQSVANQIIKGCPSFSVVRFAYWNSGWVHTYGLMPNGNIRLFDCLEPGRGVKPKWGQVICT